MLDAKLEGKLVAYKCRISNYVTVKPYRVLENRGN
jgi:hypothetical protein